MNGTLVNVVENFLNVYEPEIIFLNVVHLLSGFAVLLTFIL